MTIDENLVFLPGEAKENQETRTLCFYAIQWISFFGGVGGGCFEGEARNWTRITIGVEAHMNEDAPDRLK
ncbi:hypothetical protein HID58_073789, partial [Brassica napus]